MGHRRELGATQVALEYISRRSLSESKLRHQLERRGFSLPDIDQAIAQVRRDGYLDDKRLAENIAHHASVKGRGPRWLEQALERRGLPNHLTREMVAQAHTTQMQQARRIVAKRYGPISIKDPNICQRAIRFLLGRGFDQESAQQVSQELYDGIVSTSD